MNAPAALSLTLAALTAEIGLKDGESYAGIIIGKDGAESHHVILLPGETAKNHQGALDWAKDQGGDLPTRRELNLLRANLAEEFKTSWDDWYWSSEQDASDPSYAWMQYFGDGGQYCYHASDEYRARAVRRVPIR